MVALVYPSNLPVPSVVSVQSDERRLMQADDPRITASMQRDRLAMQQVVFVFATFVECEAFRGWWKSVLVYGGLWFSAEWVLPQGMVAATRRFIGVPRWEYIAPIGWRVSATCELRGVSLPPQSYRELYFTSWLYPLDVPEAMGSAVAPTGGYLVTWPEEFLDAGVVPLAGTLVSTLNQYADQLAEGLDTVSVRPSAGTLVNTLNQYTDQLPEGLDTVSVSLQAGTLVETLVSHTTQLAEGLDTVSVTPLSGTLV